MNSMYKIKGVYYCNNCEKNVDAEISVYIRAVYAGAQVEVGIRAFCAECKMPMDMTVALIPLKLTNESRAQD